MTVIDPRQVASSQPFTARTSSERLPSRIWINEHLTYTHGMGFVWAQSTRSARKDCRNSLSKISSGATTTIQVKSPQIYYGEKTDRIVSLRPWKRNSTTHRAMRTFIPSTAEVVAFRFRPSGEAIVQFPFQGTKIILSSAITPESRLMFERSIPTRDQGRSFSGV